MLAMGGRVGGARMGGLDGVDYDFDPDPDLHLDFDPGGQEKSKGQRWARVMLRRVRRLR